MILLKKKNQDETYYAFDKILESGYKIKELPDIIAKKKFVNGKRKKIISNYTDVVITVDLGCYDGNTLAEVLEYLIDGEYEYYSLNDKTYKDANFIVTLPEQTIENCASDVIVGDFTVTLEKSSDVSD